jgi:hypothetical protein
LTLTDDKIKELENEMQICQALYDQYLNTPIKQMWNKELNEFLTAYDKWCKEWEEENVIADKADPNAKSKGSKRSKASQDDLTGDNDKAYNVSSKKKQISKKTPTKKDTNAAKSFISDKKSTIKISSKKQNTVKVVKRATK